MPKSADIHRNRPLENISIAFKNDRLIASQLSTTVPVLHESDTYYVYSRDSLILPITARGNGAQANEATWNVSTSSYVLTEHSLKSLVTDRDRDNADTPIKLDIDTTEYLTEKILMRREVALQILVQTTTTWANNTSLTTTLAWNTSSTNIITQLDSAASMIAQSSGKLPNCVAMNDQVYRVAKENTSTVDRVKYTSADSIGPEVLARLFTVDRVLVAGGIINNAEENTGVDTMAFIWADHVFMGYVESAPGLKKASALYTLEGRSFGTPYRVKKYREEGRDGDWIEVQSMYQHIAPATACGYLIKDVIV